MNKIIADSACLISLDRINQIHLLKDMYTNIFVPPAVVKEFSKSFDWMIEKEVKSHFLIKYLMAQLGRGESEVIALSTESPEYIAILDDKKARRIAKDLEIRVIGTIGILLKAKKIGLLNEIRPLLDDLIRNDFHVSKALYIKTLNLSNESN